MLQLLSKGLYWTAAALRGLALSWPMLLGCTASCMVLDRAQSTPAQAAGDNRVRCLRSTMCLPVGDVRLQLKPFCHGGTLDCTVASQFMSTAAQPGQETPHLEFPSFRLPVVPDLLAPHKGRCSLGTCCYERKHHVSVARSSCHKCLQAQDLLRGQLPRPAAGGRVAAGCTDAWVAAGVPLQTPLTTRCWRTASSSSSRRLAWLWLLHR